MAEDAAETGVRRHPVSHVVGCENPRIGRRAFLEEPERGHFLPTQPGGVCPGTDVRPFIEEEVDGRGAPSRTHQDDQGQASFPRPVRNPGSPAPELEQGLQEWHPHIGHPRHAQRGERELDAPHHPPLETEREMDDHEGGQ